jgi:hypothetical protein
MMTATPSGTLPAMIVCALLTTMVALPPSPRETN